MKALNKLRLNAGIPIDPSIEITTQPLKEARETPKRKSDVKNTDSKSLKAKSRGLLSAVKHIKAGIAALEKIPATDFAGDVPRFIGELEDLLDSGGSSGIEAYQEHVASELRKIDGAGKVKARKEEEEEQYAELEAKQAVVQEEPSEEVSEDEDDEFIKGLSDVTREQLKAAIAAIKMLNPEPLIRENAEKVINDITDGKLAEAMHYYGVQYDGYEEDKDKPINVVDGSSNDEQVWDKEEETEKEEGPNQLKTMDQQDNSEQDKSGNDLSNKVKVTASVKSALSKEISKAESEMKRLDSRDKDAAAFYKDLANAFSDLLGHLEKGTVYDLKQAQVFAQTLMGPMLHKIPTNVWKFLTNGGETRSLKSFMKEVKGFPTAGSGPRNTLK